MVFRGNYASCYQIRLLQLSDNPNFSNQCLKQSANCFFEKNHVQFKNNSAIFQVHF